MATFQQLIAELAITIANRDVWLAIGLALLLGGLCLAFGIWVTRLVGLLRSDAPAGEVIGVGLGAGLMVVAAWWAAIWSGGRSSFTPVAVGFAIAIVWAVGKRVRRSRSERASGQLDIAQPVTASPPRSSRERSLVVTALAGGAFIVLIAVLYGSTIAPPPRDGLQPVEFVDEAFYAVLGRDLATTGTETNVSPSGFTEVPGLPIQTWYHWGELWLASAAITMLGTPAMAARYFVVLPAVLLAAAALTGTLVRRVAGTESRWAYAFGFLAALFLAPLPVLAGPFFSSFATGMIFGITLYGLGAVAGLFGLYLIVALDNQAANWTTACFAGSALAFIFPAHAAIAGLGLIGVFGVWTLRAAKSVVAARRIAVVSSRTIPIVVATALLFAATLAWGVLTGHGNVATPPSVLSQSSPVVPFNPSWRESVAINFLGAGLFLAIPIAWFVRRREAPAEAELYLGTMGIVVLGALAWGARLGDFTMFYLFFTGIAVFATPIGAIAAWRLWERLRATKHLMLAAGLVVLALVQLEVGAVTGLLHLQLFGPNTYEPISVGLLESIKLLPADAKLAYACHPLEETGFGTPRLVSIDAHTSRRVVPMCFEAETLSALNGAALSDQLENLYFATAPQRALYPDAAASPSPTEVAAFLKANGIDFIYADPRHPNTLVPDAPVIATSGNAKVLAIP